MTKPSRPNVEGELHLRKKLRVRCKKVAKTRKKRKQSNPATRKMDFDYAKCFLVKMWLVATGCSYDLVPQREIALTKRVVSNTRHTITFHTAKRAFRDRRRGEREHHPVRLGQHSAGLDGWLSVHGDGSYFLFGLVVKTHTSQGQLALLYICSRKITFLISFRHLITVNHVSLVVQCHSAVLPLTLRPSDSQVRLAWAVLVHCPKQNKTKHTVVPRCDPVRI